MGGLGITLDILVKIMGGLGITVNLNLVGRVIIFPIIWWGGLCKIFSNPLPPAMFHGIPLLKEV